MCIPVKVMGTMMRSARNGQLLSLQNISEVRVLLVRQIHERQLISLLLIHRHSVLLLIFSRKDDIQRYCSSDRDAVTTPR
jgi:hypothetical protein